MSDELARTVMARCDALAACSEEDGRITRRFATPALQQANDLVAGWMRAAGMVVRQDDAGNVIGRYEADRASAPTLLLGSHLDSVRDAGRYDGPLGVLVALAAVERLHAHARRLPFALEVLGFADEEGVRYHTAYLGSTVVAGTFDSAWLDRRDDDAITLADAVRAFGGDPARLSISRRDPADLLGYVEVHIEQGPVLEAQNFPVGIVTAIAGQSRLTLQFAGVAGHAGTVPMELRHDALCAAAEFVLAAEALGRATPGLVATVGHLAVASGASNVIPGAVTLSLDVRHHDDDVREHAVGALHDRAAQIAATRGIALDWQVVQEHGSTPCDPALTERMAQAVAECNHPLVRLASGAGHDGVALADLTGIAMLFVRCAGGISHNPSESVALEDVAVAINVLVRFLELNAQSLSH